MRILAAREETTPAGSAGSRLVNSERSGNTPCGVSTYRSATARLTVDSCTPTSSATCRRASGLIRSGPCSRKSRCRRDPALPAHVPLRPALVGHHDPILVAAPLDGDVGMYGRGHVSKGAAG